MGHVHLSHDNLGARPLPVSSIFPLYMARSTNNDTLGTFSSNLASAYGAKVSMPVRDRRHGVALRNSNWNTLEPSRGDLYSPITYRHDAYLE